MCMKHGLLLALLVLFLMVLLPFAGAEEPCPTPTICEEATGIGTGGEPICVYFFYGQGCSHCARVEPYIRDVETRYPGIQVKSLEVYHNATNREIFMDFLDRYGIEPTEAGVPILFIGDRALIGENSIQSNLEPSILYFQEHEPICPETYKKYDGNPHDLSPGYIVDLTLPSVILAAAIDSVNPCAFGVLILLLVYLTTLRNRTRILNVGFAYIGTIFVVYFLSGLGFFYLVQKSGISGIIYTIAAFVAIGAGIVNLQDVLLQKKTFRLSIPESKKQYISEYIQKASVPTAIVLGGLVSIFELPCTGAIYLAILGLLSSKMTMFDGIPYLLLYNFIFILPLILILLGVTYGIAPERVQQWRTVQKASVRTLMGLLMIGIGIAMLLQVI